LRRQKRRRVGAARIDERQGEHSPTKVGERPPFAILRCQRERRRRADARQRGRGRWRGRVELATNAVSAAHTTEVTTAFTLTFHLLLQLVEESPVSALREDFLRARLDDAHLVQAQGIEPYRVGRIVLTPLA